MKYYFDFFQDLKDLYSEDIAELSMYEGHFAKLYDRFPPDKDEIEIYVSEALQCGRNILELCCGNGRLTIPLAEHGFNVDGIDLSDDMLDCLYKKRSKLSKTIQKRINCTYGNIFEVDINKTYDFILLPSTTISILADEEDKLIELFSKMHSILNDDGTFIFDCRNDYEQIKKSKSDIYTMTEKNEEYTSLTLIQEFSNYIYGRSIGNFYTQVQYKDRLEKYITSTNKKIITEEFINELAEKSFFEIYKKTNLFQEDFNLTFWILKKKGKCK